MTELGSMVKVGQTADSGDFLDEFNLTMTGHHGRRRLGAGAAGRTRPPGGRAAGAVEDRRFRQAAHLTR
jgi:hypothetical protein